LQRDTLNKPKVKVNSRSHLPLDERSCYANFPGIS
jgi:hypothetical protein